MIGNNKSRITIYAIGAALGLLLGLAAASRAHADPRFFAKSYAVVVGINTYPHRSWTKLTYAVKDAEGIAAFLRTQEFEVIALYEKNATRQAIIAAVEDRLLPKLTEQDRVLFFFAGHGRTLTVGDKEYGYLVPYDGDDSFASLVPMYQIRDLSSLMSRAKHQLFILDACFGGLIAMRSSTARSIDPRTTPKYIEEITNRKARQVLTAGGADQFVADGGPDGHSLFTGELIKALKEGLADRNGDGYITFAELTSYIQVAASDWRQTPGTLELPGHQQGEFIFLNPARQQISQRRQTSAGGSRSADVDVYEFLKSGKVFFAEKNYIAAREQFFQAAEMGNAEAMFFLAGMYWKGWGVSIDTKIAHDWLHKAADRGEIRAMESLGNIHSMPGRYLNLKEGSEWKLVAAEAEKLRELVLEPTVIANLVESVLPVEEVIIAPPAAPTNLSVE